MLSFSHGVIMGIIYYLVPDLHRRQLSLRGLFRAIKQGRGWHYCQENLLVKPKPVGGIKVMYQHCQLLTQLGYQAYPLLMGKYHGNFFDYDVKTKKIKEIGYQLSDSDIVVSPEFLPYLGLQFSQAKKIIFNQSQSWLYHQQRVKAVDRDKDFLALGYDNIICCSDYLTDLLQQYTGLQATTITNGIDHHRFCPRPEKRISRRVLALAGKNTPQLQTILELAKKRDFSFRIVDGLSESMLIDEYQQADIFLAIAYPEGFCLPPLEAMHCGCVVVGFTGGGGNEYMVDGYNALTAADGDCQAVVDCLARLEHDIQFKETLRKASQESCKKYSLARTQRQLHHFYQPLLEPE